MYQTTTSHAELVSAPVYSLEDCSLGVTSKIATDPEINSG
tara:strand:+ start:6002 stop:6121 length:120 start_codon:yes stop_codon:yes gene_type:complete